MKYVVILKYQSTLLLVIDSVIDTAVQCAKPSFLESGAVLHALKEKAESLALSAGTSVRLIELPEILDEPLDQCKILNLADNMGILKRKKSLYEYVISLKDNAFHEGVVAPTSIPDCVHWHFSDLKGLSFAELKEKTAWAPTFGNTTYNFSFKSICDAIMDKNGNWVIQEKNSRELILIDFK